VKRFLAIAASVTMIVVAIIVRSAIDDNGDGGGSSSKRLTIACVTELESACRALTNVDVRIEDAGVTARALANGTAQLDGWVTFDPWPQMVDALARHGVTRDTKPIVSSDIELAMVQERADAIAPSCGGAVNWRCLGDAIGRPWTDVGGRPEWGTVKAGIPATTTALGVLLLGNAATSYFQTNDFATNDFDADFLLWRSKVTGTPATFPRFILEFPAAFSAVGTVHAVATANGTGNRPVATSTTGSVTAVVTTTGNDVSRIADPLRRALTDAGWGAPASAASNLPSPGVLLALSGLTG
jgi:hypothetical protein